MLLKTCERWALNTLLLIPVQEFSREEGGLALDTYSSIEGAWEQISLQTSIYLDRIGTMQIRSRFISALGEECAGLLASIHVATLARQQH